jgi:hypothetical protein
MRATLDPNGLQAKEGRTAMAYEDWLVDAATAVDLATIRCRVAGGTVTTLGQLLERAGIDLAKVEVLFTDSDSWMDLAAVTFGELAGAAREEGTTGTT